MSIPTARELAEIAHTSANRYSYEGEWGIRRKSRSDKAAMENFVQESRETRATLVAAAVRDAVLDALIASAESGSGDAFGLDHATALADWVRSFKDAA